MTTVVDNIHTRQYILCVSSNLDLPDEKIYLTKSSDILSADYAIIAKEAVVLQQMLLQSETTIVTQTKSGDQIVGN